MYNDGICLLAPTASTKQSLWIICYDYGTDNDIVFNPLKLVCTIFITKTYKVYFPTVLISEEALTNIYKYNYLCFCFSDLKINVYDMLHATNTITVAKSNK